MTQNKSSKKPKIDKVENEASVLAENSTQVLIRESEMLQALFIQVENSIQSIFNFYLTLVTAIAGGIALIMQFATQNPAQTWLSMVSIGGLFLFIAISGSAYITSLAIRHAHTIRYARIIDEIRRFLFSRYDNPAPTIYKNFLFDSTIKKREKSEVKSTSGFFLIGIHELFVAIINSLAWASVGYIILLLDGIPSLKLIQSIILFLPILVFYIIYANFLIRRIVFKLNVSVEM